jgi:putative tricarboxylic transport membrane protein
MEQFLTIFSSFTTVIQPLSLFYLVMGFFIGILFGALPGLTATLAIVLLLPLTYTMPINYALVMCMGVYMAGIYSGSITAITVNIPGAPASLMTCIEGHHLMKQGKGAKAIGHVTIGSAIGGAIGALLLIFISPLTMQLALKIRTPGKFSLILFAMVVIIMISKDKKKGIISLVFGMIMATIGMDPVKRSLRFTFGIPQLIEGIDITTLIVGAFAIGELFTQSTVNNEEYKKMTDAANSTKFKRKDFFPTFKEMKEVGVLTYLKSTFIGYLIGVLPGAGASMAAFIAYGEAKRSSKHPERFEHGAWDGLVAGETANNAVCGGALVPMLSLGIPGDGVTAVLLGVFMVYGIVPGPSMFTSQLDALGPMYISLFLSAAILLPLSLFLVGPYYLKIIKINRLVLYGTIALVAILGVYAATLSVFQIGIALLIGIIMFFLTQQKYPNVPFILGVILGPLFERYLRSSLTLGNGNPAIFITQMDSLLFLILIVVFAFFINRSNRREE